MIVIGDDIGNLVIQGYQNGGCRPGEEMDITADVTRFEAPLGEVIELLIEEYVSEQYGFMLADAGTSSDELDNAMLNRAVLELLFDYGILSDNTAWRYASGMLDDIIFETLVMDRVFYMTAEIEIPAFGSVGLKAETIKTGSFDFYGWGSGNMGVYGYGMMTTLGSSLVFDSMTVSVAGAQWVDIVRQNLGFDPVSSARTQTLDLSVPHYYIEVRGRQGDG
jgi:hypothetical protein